MLLARSAKLVLRYRSLGKTIAAAESCTGGLLAALITEISGASAVLERGFVVYSNAAKHELLGVAQADLDAYGAVSEVVARAMAAGALLASHADVGLAITGIAGPAGGSPAKPVGLVYCACAQRNGALIALERRFGDIGRPGVRLAALEAALAMLEAAAD